MIMSLSVPQRGVSILAMLAAGWVAGLLPASAQERAEIPKSPAKVAAATPTPVQADPAVEVAPGKSKTFSFDPAIEGVEIADRAVCNVRQVRRGFIVQGLKLGQTSVTIWGEGFGIKTFDVVVLPDRTAVLTRLRQQYPQANLQLVPAPETGKVVVEGTLPSHWAIEDVLKQLEGPDLSKDQILSRLTFACPVPCVLPCMPPCGPPSAPARWGRR